MENYITSIKDLVIQALTNSKEIKKKAKEDDPSSCLQMGMIHLLGINTQIDFKEATTFFTNLSLADNPEANRLLGLIAECEGNYSLAFDYYAKANRESDQAPYFNKVYKEREELREFLIKNKMPQRALNNVITTVLEEYNKKKSKLSASIKLAVICNDKQSYMEVAQNFCDEGDFSSAIYWLKNADADTNSPLYTTILNKIQESSITLKDSKEIQLIEIEGNSLLLDSDFSTTFSAAIRALKEIPSLCRDLWRKGVSKKVKQIKDKWEKEEKSKKEREKAEYNALLKQQEEEDALRKKKRKRIFIITGIAIWIFLGILVALIPSSSDKEASQNEEINTLSNESAPKTDNLDSNNSEDIYSESYVKKYLEEIFPKAIKMNEKDAVEKFFSKDFVNLYRKVEQYDEANIGEGELGFWDFDFWTGGQDGELDRVSVVKISDIAHNKANAVIQYIIKFGEYDESKSSVSFNLSFENGKWCLDDFNSYKFRFKEYLGSGDSGYDKTLSERRLSEDDLADKTKKELEIMRNSIYARYGYKFKRADLLDHFSQYSWYTPTTSDMEDIYNKMNDNEKYNIDFIKKHE